MKTTLKEKRYIRRLAQGAIVFFGANDMEKNDMMRALNRASFIDTPEEMRLALRLKTDEWNRYLGKFMADLGKVTLFGLKGWGECQMPATLPGSGGKSPELEAALKQIAERDSMLKELREKMADQSSRKVGPIEIIIKKDDKKFRHIKRAHMTMPELLMRCGARVHTYLVGPAGSGKTTAAEQVADSLGLEFGFMSVGPQTTKSDIFGYMDVKGDYVTTEFRKRYEKGGVFLFDEMDSGNGGVLTSVNAALAGSCCAFPDKMVKRHPDFVCIGAGNTYGTGPDRVYVGRQELDGASLDRFDFLEWGYDEGLELEIAKSLWEEEVQKATEWTEFVQKVRKAVAKLGLRHIVSPRATMHGIKLLKAGAVRDRVVQTSVWKNLKPAEVNRIEASMAANINNLNPASN